MFFLPFKAWRFLSNFSPGFRKMLSYSRSEAKIGVAYKKCVFNPLIPFINFIYCLESCFTSMRLLRESSWEQTGIFEIDAANEINQSCCFSTFKYIEDIYSFRHDFFQSKKKFGGWGCWWNSICVFFLDFYYFLRD